MNVIFRGPRTLAQNLAFAVAKAVAVTLTFLAGHVTVSVATDLYGLAAPAQPAPVEVIDVRQTQVLQIAP